MQDSQLTDEVPLTPLYVLMFPSEFSVGLEATFSSHSKMKTTSALLDKTCQIKVLYCLPMLCCDNSLYNPGPQWKFPFGICEGPVKCNQRGIQCDYCDKWYKGVDPVAVSAKEASNLRKKTMDVKPSKAIVCNTAKVIYLKINQPFKELLQC